MSSQPSWLALQNETLSRMPHVPQTLHKVPGVGIEPTWDFSRGILSPLRLPFRHPGRTTIILRSDCSLPEGYDRLPHPYPASRFSSGQRPGVARGSSWACATAAREPAAARRGGRRKTTGRAGSLIARFAWPHRDSHSQEPNDGCRSGDMHQHEHPDPCRGYPREGSSSVARKQHVWQERQQQNPEGDPTKERLGPIRTSTNDPEDGGRSERAHSCEEDCRGRSRQGGKLGRNVESG